MIQLIKSLIEDGAVESDNEESASEIALTLPKIGTYDHKLKIIEWLKSGKDLPNRVSMFKDFKGIKVDDMKIFKEIHTKHNAITFVTTDVQPEEEA